ncbi:MAG: cell division protein FtsQ [Prevotella sp.]|nr:cell division protein FtsQ [Prevotella sp.]MBP5506787.1 cell division protein FtsQ [Prevotella sp.]
MYINWKKTLMVTLDVVLAAYIILAVTSFNRPDRSKLICEKVRITIADKDSSGFLSALDVKKQLTDKQLYPKGQKLSFVDLRAIESTLMENPFINTAECYKTEDGNVGIIVTQRLPLLRVKGENGEDYYLDTDGNIIKNNRYTSDLIVVTGNISNWYAQEYVVPAVRWLTENELWNSQVEQINILPDKNMELVPRIGNHIVCLGRLPESADKERRVKNINKFMEMKFGRLDKFYRYGLNEVGWNKYCYIDLEFDNQVICRKSKQHSGDTKQPVGNPSPASSAGVTAKATIPQQ